MWNDGPFSEADQAAFPLAIAFLDGRLATRDTINWALNVPSTERAKRSALLRLAHFGGRDELTEPWRSAWRLVEEFWNTRPPERHSGMQRHELEERIAQGERSGVLIRDIVEFVKPRLVLTARDGQQGEKIPRGQPREVGDILQAQISSERVVDPARFKIDEIDDAQFLSSLARGLETALDYGHDLARQLGWDLEAQSWRLGMMHRVYYVRDRAVEDEPDEYDTGLTPATKLLFAAVSRLATIEPEIAQGFVRGWRLRKTVLFRRLWSAAAADPSMAAPPEVEAFIDNLSSEEFWNVHSYPEYAELRAKRYGDLSDGARRDILRRIRLRPPKGRWGSASEPDRIDHARTYWKARELRRIEVAGWELPARDARWLLAQREDFPELADMRVDHGFSVGVQVYSADYQPDNSLDGLAGADRLRALQHKLSTGRSFDDNPAEQASAWLRADQNIAGVLSDLQNDPEAGADYPEIWERLGWAHTSEGRDVSDEQKVREAEAVIALLERLPSHTIERAISGITYWMSNWSQSLRSDPGNYRLWARLWHRVWPLAVEATNREQGRDEVDLGVAGEVVGDHEPMDLDTLNTPAGRMYGVFRDLFPNLNQTPRPFQTVPELGAMRDALDEADGRASLIVRHRMMESISYLLAADEDWAAATLIPELEADTPRALVLWRAVVRAPIYANALERLAEQLVFRATDMRLRRETRERIVFRIVVEGLWTLFEGRAAKIPLPEIQQMIRRLEPEVRSHGAEAVARFILDSSKGENAKDPETLFDRGVVPFMAQGWPQERSLVSPGVSKAFAEIPAASRNRFAEAVELLTRFMVPFDCWSMIDYGLYGEDDGQPRLTAIDDASKAAAFLTLLDLTVGHTENAVVPHDLGKALGRIREVAPSLAASLPYRRLAAAARL